MPMNRLFGFWIVVGGACLVVIGLLVYSGGFNWFGRLPGDIRYESDRAGVYIPIVSMLIVSLALSLIFYLIRKFF
jgi:heme/copper-type cytochrome/quinol oxidase subunit 1